jgi:hypothetical protein
MPSGICKTSKSLLLIITLSFSGAVLCLGAAQDAAKSTADGHQYFPSGPSPASPLFAVLRSLDEPSFFQAANDPKFVALRASYFAPVPTHEIAVRLVVNAEGSGEVTSAIMMDSKSGVKRTQNDISAAEVARLFQLLAKSDFWSIPSTVEETTTNAAGHKVYLIDGPHWMVEAVREGSFHYVYRYAPKINPVAEIGCALAKDVTNPNGSIIQNWFCNPRNR